MGLLISTLISDRNWYNRLQTIIASWWFAGELLLLDIISIFGYFGISRATKTIVHISSKWGIISTTKSKKTWTKRSYYTDEMFARRDRCGWKCVHKYRLTKFSWNINAHNETPNKWKYVPRHHKQNTGNTFNSYHYLITPHIRHIQVLTPE